MEILAWALPANKECSEIGVDHEIKCSHTEIPMAAACTAVPFWIMCIWFPGPKIHAGIRSSAFLKKLFVHLPHHTPAILSRTRLFAHLFLLTMFLFTIPCLILGDTQDLMSRPPPGAELGHRQRQNERSYMAAKAAPQDTQTELALSVQPLIGRRRKRHWVSQGLYGPCQPPSKSCSHSPNLSLDFRSQRCHWSIQHCSPQIPLYDNPTIPFRPHPRAAPTP